MNTYYVVKFKFKDKAECEAMSADFVIESGSSFEEVQKKANKVAKSKLLKFFSYVLPDEALPFLKDPEYVVAVPVRNL